MRAIKVAAALIGMVLSACASNDPSSSVHLEEVHMADNCAPGAVMERLADEKKVSIISSYSKNITKMYLEYFQIMRKCDLVKDFDFVVHQEWADERIRFLSSFPPLPSLHYEQRVSRSDGLCLILKRTDTAEVRQPRWYCEKSGWTDEM